VGLPLMDQVTSMSQRRVTAASRSSRQGTNATAAIDEDEVKVCYVGNHQKWDTFVKERSGGDGGVLGLPEQAVVAFASL